jgi:hypothetical protein
MFIKHGHPCYIFFVAASSNKRHTNKYSKYVKSFQMFSNVYVEKQINNMRFVFSNTFAAIKWMTFRTYLAAEYSYSNVLNAPGPSCWTWCPLIGCQDVSVLPHSHKSACNIVCSSKSTLFTPQFGSQLFPTQPIHSRYREALPDRWVSESEGP